MAVGYTHRYARLLCSTKRKDRKRVDVTVHNIPALLFIEALKLSLVFDNMLVGRNLENPAAERFNLVTGNKRRIGIDKKVKLYFAVINMAVVIHDDSLNTAANHLANDLSYSNRFSHLASTATGKDLNDREENDLEIGDHAALGDILEITLNHAIEVGVIAVGHLPPAGDPGLDGQAL